MKQCSMCGQVKDTSEFYKDKTRKDGVRPQCKICSCARSKAYHEANRERCLGRSRAWFKANKEKHQARSKEWFKANPDKRMAYDKAWRDAHPEKCRAKSKAWFEANPEKRRAIDHRRRVRKLGNGGSHTGQDIIRQGEMQKWVCWWKLPGCTGYCKDDYHVDHRVPLSRGGSDNPDNIVISCPHCNLVKGSKMPEEFGVLL